jgi:hypothetical protein
MAPEQLRGETAGAATDVYATGVLLTEMITGEPPYDVSTPVELVEAQKTPPLVIGDAPPELAAIVRRALDPDLKKRQSSAATLAAELRSWLESDAAPAVAGTPDQMTEAAVVVPAAAVIGAAVASQPDPPEAPRPEAEPPAPVPPGPPRSRDTRLWAVIGAAGLVVLALWVITQSLGPDGLGAASPSASVIPSVAVTPAPTPVPTPIPTPVPAPPTLDAAVHQFRQTVAAGQQNGEIDEGAAGELDDQANRFVEDDDLKGGDINRIVRDLNRKIDEFERDGEIGSAALATELRRLVDEMEAAARRQKG